MKKYRVHFETTAGCSVEVEVPDDTPEYEIRELAIEKGYEGLPGGVCAQCSGWGRKYSLDLGEFEVATEEVKNADGTGWVKREVEPELIED